MMTLQIDSLVDFVRSHMPSANTTGVTPEDVANVLADAPIVVAQRDWNDVVMRVHDYAVGPGPLGPLLRDPRVTDIFVNSPSEVWADFGAGAVRTAAHFVDENAVRECARRLAATSGLPLDDVHPYVDAVLPTGQRLHAVIPPLSVRGTVMSLRCFGSRARTLTDLHATGMFDADVLQVLRQLVKMRRSLLVSGGTGSGKTTLVAALLSECDERDRIVIVEDTNELQPIHPHVVSLQARGSAALGNAGLSQLVRQSLRMRPDRIVVGEVRGEEVIDLLTALNTGHTGALTTVHANGAAQVLARLEFLAARSQVKPAALRQALVHGVDVIIHLQRHPHRHISEIAVTSDGEYDCALSVWQQDGDVTPEGERALRELCAA